MNKIFIEKAGVVYAAGSAAIYPIEPGNYFARWSSTTVEIWNGVKFVDVGVRTGAGLKGREAVLLKVYPDKTAEIAY